MGSSNKLTAKQMEELQAAFNEQFFKQLFAGKKFQFIDSTPKDILAQVSGLSGVWGAFWSNLIHSFTRPTLWTISSMGGATGSYEVATAGGGVLQCKWRRRRQGVLIQL
jgi:hypothetical protein